MPSFNHQTTLSELPVDVQLMHSTSTALLWGGILLLLSLTIGWIAQHPIWSFNRIEIKGDLEHNGTASIRAYAIPLLKGNFFTLNLEQARLAFKAVPWVRDAQVRRIWPNTLEVQLQEHQAVALWKSVANSSSKEFRSESNSLPTGGLVNNQGELFYANTADVEDEKLPQFIGTEDRVSEMWHLYRTLLPILAPLGRMTLNGTTADINQLRISARGSWSVQIDNQVQIEIGRGSSQEILNRCTRFMSSVFAATDAYQKKWRYADLRYPEGYALRIVEKNTQTH